MKIRLASDLQPDSIVDGEGIRTVIWTQGCPHHCPGCHNPQTHDPKGGALVDLEYIFNEIDELSAQDGITFSGGDPFVQAKECSVLAAYAKKKGYNIWCYTGYTFEDLLKLGQKRSEIIEFLEQIDVLVDGRFLLEQKSLDCIFRGSKNQRIIDVPESLKRNETVLVKKYAERKIRDHYQKEEYMYL